KAHNPLAERLAGKDNLTDKVKLVLAFRLLNMTMGVYVSGASQDTKQLLAELTGMLKKNMNDREFNKLFANKAGDQEIAPTTIYIMDKDGALHKVKIAPVFGEAKAGETPVVKDVKVTMTTETGAIGQVGSALVITAPKSITEAMVNKMSKEDVVDAN
ncbi:MAG: hypothetical protein HQL26_11205, partial [Candidatus Omnitrophica bacterium]|nr:hypothetical protein [Candidatus Omnitrophota bacterium]